MEPSAAFSFQQGRGLPAAAFKWEYSKKSAEGKGSLLSAL